MTLNKFPNPAIQVLVKSFRQRKCCLIDAVNRLRTNVRCKKHKVFTQRGELSFWRLLTTHNFPAAVQSFLRTMALKMCKQRRVRMWNSLSPFSSSRAETNLYCQGCKSFQNAYPQSDEKTQETFFCSAQSFSHESDRGRFSRRNAPAGWMILVAVICRHRSGPQKQ